MKTPCINTNRSRSKYKIKLKTWLNKVKTILSNSTNLIWAKKLRPTIFIFKHTSANWFKMKNQIWNKEGLSKGLRRDCLNSVRRLVCLFQNKWFNKAWISLFFYVSVISIRPKIFLKHWHMMFHLSFHLYLWFFSLKVYAWPLVCLAIVSMRALTKR